VVNEFFSAAFLCVLCVSAWGVTRYGLVADTPHAETQRAQRKATEEN